MNTARAIREARLSAGLTQAQLAERAGTSQTAISAYEQTRKIPSLSTLARLLAAAGRRLTTEPASSAVRTPTAAELQQRSSILRQVIDLAERLPSRRGRQLLYPGIPRPIDGRQ